MVAVNLTPARRSPAATPSRDAFDTVAWRTPPLHRFDGHAVGGATSDHQTVAEMLKALPHWVVIAGGGVVAAIMGAMLGGALHI